jgi:hypothetical protein
MIFDFFTARLQRKKYETATAMSMGFTDFFHNIFTRPIFPRFEAQEAPCEAVITPAVGFAACGRYAVRELERFASPSRQADWRPISTSPSDETRPPMAAGF